MRTLTGFTGGGCVFNCSPTAADSIEHYARCPCLRGWARHEFRLPHTPADEQLAEFMILSPVPQMDASGTPIRRAIIIAAAYHVHGLVRHGRVLRGPAALEALHQVSREMVKGHGRAGLALDAAEWSRFEDP